MTTHAARAGLALASLAVVAAGCSAPAGSVATADGAAADTAADSEAGDEVDALLAHAQCLRDAGFDYPDPTISTDGGGVEVTQDGGPDGDDPGFAAADERCREEHLAGVTRSVDLDPDELAALEEQMLEIARCMRDRGIELADPTVVNGAASFEIGPDDSGELSSRETLHAAEEECGMDDLPAVDVRVRS